MSVVMGTAGHIDHGKTSLVKKLTGMDCDRLEEEKRRKITIELGFSFLTLANGEPLSIVDMPGHERFVKNMVSGASGVDFVALVVAADEGIMPQTREHLEICSLLGIEKGIVVLTKIDMVEADWLALVQEEIEDFLLGSFLEEAEVYPVSALTGAGIEELKLALFDIAAEYKPKRRTDLPRLAVDRVFSLHGHGTVVTGTLTSGSFSLGDDLILMPSKKTSKVRGLQSHGKVVSKAEAGYRTAVNLPMLEVSEVDKGESLTLPGRLFAATSWFIDLHCLPSSPRALRHRGEVHFHHGAKEIQARLHFFDRDKLEPGERAICQVRFNEAMVSVAGDHCVLRSFSPLRTVAGGVVLNPLGAGLRKKDAAFAEKLQALEDLAKQGKAISVEDAVFLQLKFAGYKGIDFAELCVLVNYNSTQIEKVLQLLGSKQQAFVVSKDDKLYIAADKAFELMESCRGWFEAFHKREPMKLGLSRNAVLSGWGSKYLHKLVFFVLERLLKQGVVVADGEVLRLKDHSLFIHKDAADLRSKILKLYQEAGICPPNLKDVLTELKTTAKEAAQILKLMQSSNELIKLTEEIYYEAQALEQIQKQVSVWFETNEDLGPAELKDLTNLSRKYVIALLEYFDKCKLTMRVGDKRVLRGKI